MDATAIQVPLAAVVAIVMTLMNLALGGYLTFMRYAMSRVEKDLTEIKTEQTAHKAAQETAKEKAHLLELALSNTKNTTLDAIRSEMVSKSEWHAGNVQLNSRLDELKDLLNSNYRAPRGSIPGLPVMPPALARLFGSSKAVLLLATIVVLGVLVGLGKVPYEKFIDFLTVAIPALLAAQGFEDGMAKYNPVLPPADPLPSPAPAPLAPGTKPS